MLGEELRKARLVKGLTQEELGFEAGISRNYVSLLELNQKSPTVHTLMKICDVLGQFLQMFKIFLGFVVF